MIPILCVAGIIAILFLVVQYGLFVPSTHGLPILMYHKVSETKSDDLTITAALLERQLQYLADHGYTSISAGQLCAYIDTAAPLPPKPVLITFDDAYDSHASIVAPLLVRLSCKAIFFVSSRFIGATNQWDGGGERILSVQDLKYLDSTVVEIGLHSARHKSFGSMTAEEIEDDIRACVLLLKENTIPFVPLFSYPYGKRPKDIAVYRRMTSAFDAAGIKLAFRIGNRVNKLPIRNRFEVKRITVEGTDSMWAFRTKLRKGRVKQL
jgi:peptidoglycan/xylan/chitin deacetylase (PgdA/CDA1 family)